MQVQKEVILRRLPNAFAYFRLQCMQYITANNMSNASFICTHKTILTQQPKFAMQTNRVNLILRDSSIKNLYAICKMISQRGLYTKCEQHIQNAFFHLRKLVLQYLFRGGHKSCCVQLQSFDSFLMYFILNELVAHNMLICKQPKPIKIIKALEMPRNCDVATVRLCLPGRHSNSKTPTQFNYNRTKPSTHNNIFALSHTHNQFQFIQSACNEQKKNDGTKKVT